MSPHWIVFGKACHLPVEIEHRAYWVIKKCNMAYDQANREWKLQLQELEELRLEAFENSWIHKEKVKHFHDGRILRKEFKVELKLIATKHRSRWDGPFVVTNIFPYDTVEVRDEANNRTFKVNVHQLKPYYEGLNLSSNVGEVEVIELIKPIIPEDPPVKLEFRDRRHLGQMKSSWPRQVLVANSISNQLRMEALHADFVMSTPQDRPFVQFYPEAILKTDAESHPESDPS
ncbi:hypothetical protein CR513_38500, partial [Mucuna pruriens]